MTDLRAACIHGRYERHFPYGGTPRPCEGGTEVVVKPLVEAARLLVESIDPDDWGWSETEPLRYGLTQFDAHVLGAGPEAEDELLQQSDSPHEAAARLAYVLARVDLTQLDIGYSQANAILAAIETFPEASAENIRVLNGWE